MEILLFLSVYLRQKENLIRKGNGYGVGNSIGFGNFIYIDPSSF